MRLAGKTAVITGAARGIGRCCAMHFAEQGADLVLLDIAEDIPEVPYSLGTESQLYHTSDLCRNVGAATMVEHLDVRDLDAIKKTVSRILQRFGHIDILLNNAGIAAPSGMPVHNIEEDEWLLMVDIDLNGAWRMIKAIGPLMTESRSGSIINIASTAGIVGYLNFAGYVAAKHGIIGLTKAAALDYAPLKVRVNALCPGSVRDDADMEGKMLSEIARSLDVPVAEHEDTFVRSQPMNALIGPEDIANAAIWLASDESKQVTGSIVVVDGGFSIR
jgi:NAD(P)-dependent dehydrogenase (short-subunit alcohol dehydrogenase family)